MTRRLLSSRGRGRRTAWEAFACDSILGFEFLFSSTTPIIPSFYDHPPSLSQALTFRLDGIDFRTPHQSLPIHSLLTP